MCVLTPRVCSHAWLVRPGNTCVKPRSIEWDKFVNTQFSHSRPWFNIHMYYTTTTTYYYYYWFNGWRLQSGLLSSVPSSSPRMQMSSRVCTVVPRQWTVSSGGRRSSSATPFCLVFITDRRPHSTINRRGPSLSGCSCSCLEQFTPSTSLLHLRCLSSGHASRLISSTFPIPVPDNVSYTACAVTLNLSFWAH